MVMEKPYNVRCICTCMSTYEEAMKDLCNKVAVFLDSIKNTTQNVRDVKFNIIQTKERGTYYIHASATVLWVDGDVI